MDIRALQGGFRTEKWNRGGTSQRREKHLVPSDPIRSSSALSGK